VTGAPGPNHPGYATGSILS